MKKFFSQVISSAAGFFLAGAIVILLLMFVSVSSMVSKPQVSDKSVLRIDLDGVVSERTNESILDVLGVNENAPSLEDMLKAIAEAKDNSKIVGIYIDANAVSTTPATLQELRMAIEDFRKSGKFVVSYSGNYTQGAYYVCSAASRVIMNPIGMVDWHGLASENMFFADLFKKVGVKMQVVKVGGYKSATEPFIATEMSPENREQVTAYLNSIWKNMKKDVAASRKISEEVLDSLADGFVALKSEQEVVASRLVDTLSYEDDALEYVAKLAKVEKAKDLKFVSVKTVAGLDEGGSKGEQIAVYYAFGDIVDEVSKTSMSTEAISGKDMTKDIEELKDDDDVKAVVLRINSGGGSAYASEQIWHSVKKLAEKKPVVISMGGMAASGAYYISAASDYIFADPTTLTGSIGIFGMIPDFSGLITDKLGVRFDGVKTNEHADFFTMSRPMNESERALLQTEINRGYDLFVKRVADGRKLTVERVREIAQGRVYTGEDALKIKLVDKLGTLDDAIAEAAKRINAKEYHAVHYPMQKSWFEQIMEEKAEGYADAQLREFLGEYHSAFTFVKNIRNCDRVQARIPYGVIIK